MCGIAGSYLLNSKATHQNQSKSVLESLKHRGPDNQAQYAFENCVLFHARLSIIDPGTGSNQPFLNDSNTKALVFNGEIFNYKTLSKKFDDLKTTGDVEVLFRLFEKEKLNCLDQLNGFFAFSFYDKVEDELYIVRDRYGEKPLYYFSDDDQVAFASELKPLLELTGPQELNNEALYTYLRLNYISGKQTIFKNIYRLLPGQYIFVKNKKIQVGTWYKPKTKNSDEGISELLEDAVKIRLQADVPVASFLSGGIDSSLVSALAKKHHSDLHTFSLGFADEPYFDETHYAELVAKHIGSKHHVFKLNNTDLISNIHPFLGSIDEPFADSSAFNVYVLSKHTSKHVKVALSGDGADELFMGYNKHKAELLSQKFLYKHLLPLSSPFLNLVKESRNSGLSNKIRQAKRFINSARLEPMQRYINWATISNNNEVKALLLNNGVSDFEKLFHEAFSQSEFDAVNYADLKIVLADDMLVKADRMSMQHGLEIRSPFLDYRIVEYALILPRKKKITSAGQKLILKETFKDLLPAEIFERKKKGFELPLWKWLNSELKTEIETKWLNRTMIEDQGIFDYATVSRLKQQLFSASPGDAPAKIWALIIFQNWANNFKDFIK